MFQVTEHDDYKQTKYGQVFEFAFSLNSAEELDKAHEEVIAKGTIPIKPPLDMPMNQSTAFIADPEGK